MVNKAISYIIGIIVILAIIYVAISMVTPKPASLVTSTVSPSVSSNGTVALLLTDPAQVPDGTTALNVSFNGARFHESGASNSTGFVNVNVSGTINLLSLLNVSQTLGVVSLNKSKGYNTVMLNLSSSTITINGTTYNVTLPSKSLIIHITGFNATTGATLIDLSPTIVQIVSSNQTIFVMVPSVKAVAIGSSNINSTTVHVGARVSLNSNMHSRLRLSTPNITITKASLSESNNATSFSVSVRNNGNSSVELNHILLYGIMGVDFNGSLSSDIQAKPSYALQGGSAGYGISSIISQYANSSYNLSSLFSNLSKKYGSNFSAGLSAGLSAALSSHNTSKILSSIISQISESDINISDITKNYTAFNHEFGLNISSSEYNSISANMHNRVNISVMASLHNFNISSKMLRGLMNRANAFDKHYHNMFTFIINKNGTLSLPFDANEAEGPQGYTLAAGANATFSYNGAISFGNGRILVTPIQNETYSVRVIGEQGAFASYNISAS